jgi:trigger factor
LFEDKVVDFLFDKAKITDRTVSREELEQAIESEEGAISRTGKGGADKDGAGKVTKPAKKTVAGKDIAKPASAKPAAAKTADPAPAKPAKAAKSDKLEAVKKTTKADAKPAKPAGKAAPKKAKAAS